MQKKKKKKKSVVRNQGLKKDGEWSIKFCIFGIKPLKSLLFIISIYFDYFIIHISPHSRQTKIPFLFCL